MNKKIVELKVDNKDKNFEKYLKPQWSWKTLVSIVLFCSALIFVVKDLEINFIKLFSDSIKYFGDILSRMLPPAWCASHVCYSKEITSRTEKRV